MRQRVPWRQSNLQAAGSMDHIQLMVPLSGSGSLRVITIGTGLTWIDMLPTSTNSKTPLTGSPTANCTPN